MTEPSIKGYYVLKSGQGFALIDPQGFLSGGESGPAGIFHRDTRHVRKWMWQADNTALVLDHAVRSPEGELTFTYKAPGINMSRRLTMADGRMHEALQITSDHATTLRLQYEAGFDDIFDARSGTTRQRGSVSQRRAEGCHVTETYQWKDGKGKSKTTFSFPTPAAAAEPAFAIRAGETKDFYFSYGPAPAAAADPTAQTYAQAVREAREEYRKLARYGAMQDTQAHRDLSLLISELPTGPYPYAGIPWFCTPFGRDAIITAMLVMEDYPALARGVISLQAQHQAQRTDKTAQAEPGKIFHEMRFGESSALGENPFSGYYGGVDTTALFVMLAGAYHARTNDRAFILAHYPQIMRAVEWIVQNMDRHNDYVRYSYDPNGLTHQGWKDSSDCIFHADKPGVLPKDPIALCEVQSYAYAALQAGAAFAAIAGDEALAQDLRRRADDLKARFNRDFWQDDMNVYALALDGNDKPCRVVTSNAGLALLSDIAPPERARRLAQRLMEPDSFSGFGIRTLAQGTGYDPLSYHRGSVWPHDTALVFAGFRRYGLTDLAALGAAGLLAAARHEKQMPELFGGQARQDDAPPVPYPPACRPQAWAAAAVIAAENMARASSRPSKIKTMIFSILLFAPAALAGIIVSFLLTPALWRLEEPAGLELAGHSGPAEWVIGLLVLIFWTGFALIYLKKKSQRR